MEKTNQGKKRSVRFVMFLFLPKESERPMDKKHLRQDLKVSKVGTIILTRINSLRKKGSKRHELRRDRRELRQVGLRLDGQLTTAIAIFKLRR